MTSILLPNSPPSVGFLESLYFPTKPVIAVVDDSKHEHFLASFFLKEMNLIFIGNGKEAVKAATDKPFIEAKTPSSTPHTPKIAVTCPSSPIAPNLTARSVRAQSSSIEDTTPSSEKTSAYSMSSFFKSLPQSPINTSSATPASREENAFSMEDLGFKIAAIIMDYSMPDHNDPDAINGLEAIKRIRAFEKEHMRPQIPIFFHTSEATIPEIVDGKEIASDPGDPAFLKRNEINYFIQKRTLGNPENLKKIQDCYNKTAKILEEQNSACES